MARATECDQEALRYLYVSYSHNIYGYVRSIVRGDHETVFGADTSSVTDLDQSETVLVARASLPDEQRVVVILRHVVGLTPAEIADRLGRTEGSIHGLHHPGRRALQRELRNMGSGPCTRRTGGRMAA